MSKHKRKRFLSILITAVLVFTLAISSVMAQDSEQVRTDKLSVGGESVEVIEGVTGEDDANVVADDAITADDAETEEPDADEAAETEEELPAGDGTEEADADVPEAADDDAEADAGIMTLSADDIDEDDEYGIQTLADGDVTLISGSTQTSYSSITSAFSAAKDGDTIRLNADLTENAAFSSAKSVTLDLNGKTLTSNGSTVITVEKNAQLTLMDSVGGGTVDGTGESVNDGGGVEINSSGGTVIMTGGTITNCLSKTNGSGVEIHSGGKFTMTGGVISGNTATTYGAGVCVDSGGTFIMEGGEISNNTANTNGAGIYNAGTVTISGGTISGNTASSYGGGIYNTGTVTMNGGSISGNKQEANGSPGGGGVVLYAGTFTMNGGEISKNESVYSGAGVYVYNGTFTLNDGSISENKVTTSYAGGGVCTAVNSSSTLIMNGGKITGNTAASGGGVQVCAKSTFTMNGGEVSGNTASDRGGGVELLESGCTLNLNGGKIVNNTAPKGGGVWFQNAGAVMNVSGGAVSGNTDSDGNANNVDLSVGSNAYITLGADLSMVPATLATYRAENQIGVTTATAVTESTAVQFTTPESSTDYYSTSNLYFFSDKEKADDTGNSIGVRASSDGNYLELYEITPPVFVSTYLTGSDGNIYTEATVDNYAQILSGASDWNLLTDEEKEEVNGYLTEANGGVPLTYEDLLAQAQAIAEYADFEKEYLTGSDGKLYTEATADNYEQILAGESDWDALSDEAKAQINADLTEANGGVELTYPMLLAQAKAMDFEDNYLTGSDGQLYTEATADNYEQILAGESDWDALSDEAKAQINADLTEANGGVELTYPMLLAQAKAMDFEDNYLTGSDGQLYTEATTDNYEQILAGESDWDALSDEAKAQINADLTAANGGVELTYPMLLAQAKAIEFEEKYLTDEDGNGPYTAATTANMDQILAGADDWNAMSDEEKAAVNAALTEANGGVELTYDELLAQAFMLKYLTDEDGNLYTEVNADNYLKILLGEDDWNRLSPEAQALVNMYLTAAWQEKGNEGELTYPMLLEQAKAFADSLGRVKTGDSTRLYLYVILAAAAAAAAAGVAVSRRRRV